MESGQIALLRGLVGASVALVMFPVIFSVITSVVRNRKSSSLRVHSLGRRTMIFSLFVVVAITLLRLTVGLYESYTSEASVMEPLEIGVSSFLLALKSLGVNDGYAEYIPRVKEMTAAVFDGYDFLNGLTIFYYSVMDIIAPVAGGIVVFDILTTVFPKLRLKAAFWRRRFYFSELNERSLALAKSILEKEKGFIKKPVVVFTDTYLDDESEKSSELFLAAKKIGAICVNDDLAHINICRFREKQIFLIDDEELNNIHTLTNFCEYRKLWVLRNTTIYVFYQDDSYVVLENKTVDILEKRYKESLENLVNRVPSFMKQKLSDRSKMHFPVISRIRYYENLILNLLEDVPLVEPLLNRETSKDKKEDFNLVIFGNGYIGHQMALSSSSFGQFYGYKLGINIVDKEKKDVVIDELNKNYPEFIESTKKNAELLEIYKDSREYSDPYFTLRYCESDVQRADIRNIECVDVNEKIEEPYMPQKFNVKEGDYFLVALGSDEANIAFAIDLYKCLAIDRINTGVNKDVVIAVSIFDANLCETFGSSMTPVEDCEKNIKMVAFGSVAEAYSYENVAMVKKDPRALSTHNAYRNVSMAEKQDALKKRRKDSYNYWSSYARSKHLKYRVFSAYRHYADNVSGDKADFQFNEEAFDFYYKKMLSENISSEAVGTYKYLTWLEHRRWNAYIRSVGFSARTDGKQQKNLKLKLHNCLVECKDDSVAKDVLRKDMLDEADDRDVKQYDEPKDVDQGLIDFMKKRNV